MATTIVTGVQYSGMWTLKQAHDAISASTWPVAPYAYLYGFGGNGQGGLGLGDRTSRSSPTQVGSLATWSEIGGGAQNMSVAIKLDGTLWSWGQGYLGGLGLGNTTYYSSPKQVGSLTNWLKVAAGSYFCAAIKTDGTMWAWGANNFGMVGDGTITNRSSPVQIGALTTWSKVSAGFYNCGAIKTDGTLWTWGYGAVGANGDNSTTNRSSPVQVGSLTTWQDISFSNANFGLAIQTNGTMWAWGQNGSGQLGLGNTTQISSPVQIGALTTWSKARNSQYNGLAIKTDGSLWIWGDNSHGQLGQNIDAITLPGNSSPVQVGSSYDWDKLGTGRGQALAIKSNGTLWAWGKNGSGELGLGDTVERSTPVQVGTSPTWKAIDGGGGFTLGLAN